MEIKFYVNLCRGRFNLKHIKKRQRKVLGSFISAAALSIVLLSNPVKADSVSSSQSAQATATQTNNKDKQTTQKDSKVNTSDTASKNENSKGAVDDTDPANEEETSDLTNEDEEDIYSNNLKSVQEAVGKLDKQNKAANKAIADAKAAAKKEKKAASKNTSKSKNSSKKVTSDKTNVDDKVINFNRHVKFQAAVVKRAGSKNYKVYKSISNTGKLGKKIGDAIDYANNHIEATDVYQGTKYRYWLMYVDGVRTGWVNENFFARNKIEVPKVVSLVKNPETSFYTRNAISYATDEYGDVVGNWDVDVSTQNVDTTKAGTKKVTYSVNKNAKATITFKIRKSNKEGIAEASAEVKPGTDDLKSWRKHYGSSENYVDYTTYQPESSAHTYKTNGLTFTTKYYQPLYLNQQPDLNTPQINAVGHIPEGMVMSDGWLYTSLLAHSNSTSGHIVAYDLNKLKDPYASQSLSSLTSKSFTDYVKNMKVSPYIYTGHGQGMGASDKYVYIVANEHGRYNPADSETLVQLNKSDLTINKIYTFKAWVGDSSNPRYFHNAVIVDDNTMYALYHNTKDKTYEYWMFKRSGSNWYPTEIGATGGNFVSSNAPVQGFAYDSKHKNFYIAFNDLIVKVGQAGTYKEAYTFDTGREIEGISISNNRLYVNLAQRPELLESSELTD